jgi:FtsP/CotA-like multicopper oxidase with cupredoxin domain
MGLAGLYFLRDAVEDALNLPRDEFEVPLVIQDRTFNPDGSFWYHSTFEDHFFGDKILVNGKVWPYLDVKKGKYRFRIVNGSTSRVYKLALSPPSGSLTFTVIGTELGLLEAPLDHGQPNVADAPSTTVTFVVDGRTVEQTANALGMEGMDDTVTEDQQANRAALQEFLDALAALPAGDQPVVPDAIAVVTLGTPTTDPELPQEPVEWPLATAPEAPTGDVGFPCTLVTGADVATLLTALRGVLGQARFDRAWRQFLHDWAFKKPQPWDFFNTVETVAGEDLDWFWRTWFYETWTLDQAVRGVTVDRGVATIGIEDIGSAPMPARVTVTREGGGTETLEVTVQVWLRGARTATITLPTTTSTAPIVRVEIDAAKEFPDIDRTNNVWPRP